jgi:hypothetical protein
LRDSNRHGQKRSDYRHAYFSHGPSPLQWFAFPKRPLRRARSHGLQWRQQAEGPLEDLS